MVLEGRELVTKAPQKDHRPHLPLEHILEIVLEERLDLP
jgi:hypothetical protein